MTANFIPYRKDLRAVTGSVTAAILWEELNFIFNKNPDGFWKFAQPCKHKLYKQGDSWVEELGFTYKEFRAAFGKIGIAYKSKQQLNEIENPFIKDDQEYAFISYQDRTKNLTHYRANKSLIAKILEKIKVTKSKPAPKPKPVQEPKSIQEPKPAQEPEPFEFNEFKWPQQLEKTEETAKILNGLDHKEIEKVLAVFEQTVKKNGIKKSATGLLAGLVNKQKKGELSLDKKTEFKLEDTSRHNGIKDCPYCDSDGVITMIFQSGEKRVNPKCGHPPSINWDIVKRVTSAKPGYQTNPKEKECPYCNDKNRMELQLQDDTYASQSCNHQEIKRSWKVDGLYVKKILSAQEGYETPPIAKDFKKPENLTEMLKNAWGFKDDDNDVLF
jgi:hypothetical protein